MINIYSDGGCSPNPGNGAWAFIVIVDGQEIMQSACIGESTNSICELTAAIEALKYAINIGENEINFYVDSDYVRKGITEWIPNWISPSGQRRAWTTSKGTPIKNQELWRELHQLNSQVKVNWMWVKAHNGDHYNELVDKAVEKARSTKKQTI